MIFILDMLRLNSLWGIKEQMLSTKKDEDAWISEGRVESEI